VSLGITTPDISPSHLSCVGGSGSGCRLITFGGRGLLGFGTGLGGGGGGGLGGGDGGGGGGGGGGGV